MKGRIVFATVLILAIAGILFFVWYKYEKPNTAIDIVYINVSILAYVEDKPIITDFYIKRDGYFYKNGTTLKDGAILVKVPVNSTYDFISKNRENQSYYQTIENVNINEIKPYRVVFNIIPPGNISISHNLYKNNNTIVLNISSNGPYNDISYCLDWSSHILWVKSLNYIKSNISYIPTYVKCFDTNINLKDDSLLVELKYEKDDSATENDSVNIYFLDKTLDNSSVIYDKIGGSDVEYIITNFN